MRSRPASRHSTPSGSCCGGRRSPTPPRPTAGAPPGSSSAAGDPDRGQGRRRRRGCADDVRRGGPGRTGRGRRRSRANGCAPQARSSSARRTPASWVSGRSPAGPPSGTRETRGRATTLPAVRQAAALPRWPPGWSPPRSGRTVRAVSGFPRRGRIWSASNRSGAASPRGRCRRPSTASPSTACWPAPSPMRRCCSTPRRATSTATATGHRRYRRPKPSPARRARLKIALSTKFPFNVFRPKLDPEIRDALHTVGEQLTDLGHTIVAADPDYKVGMSWNFLSRSTSGLLDWAERLGHGVELDRRTVENLRTGTAAVGERAAQGPREGSRRPAPRRLHLQPRRRDPGADDRAAAADGAPLRQARRPVHRSSDDPRLPRDVAVEPAGVAVDQRARRLHIARDYRSACN